MSVIPFTLVPLILYVVAAMFAYEHATYAVDTLNGSLHPFWSKGLFTVDLVSGQTWALSYGDALVTLAIILMLFNLLRTASIRKTSVLSNMVMVLVLCAYVVTFLVFDFAGTSVFFLLTIIALVDTLATVSMSMVASHSKVEPVPTN
ncbi:MAG: hypothetical protein AAGD34_03815 [Pseudomonadota bacterium]